MNEFKTICLNGLFKLLNSTRLESGNIGAKTNVFDYDVRIIVQQNHMVYHLHFLRLTINYHISLIISEKHIY